MTAFKELNDTFGTSVEFNQKQLATQTKLKEAAGLPADEAAKLAEYEQLTGKSSEDVYNNIGKTNKVLKHYITTDGIIRFKNSDLVIRDFCEINDKAMSDKLDTYMDE